MSAGTLSLDVIFPCHLRPGMVVLGQVDLNAPSRPVQPIAAALTVESIEHTEVKGVKYMRPIWTGGLSGQRHRLYEPGLSYMVLVGAVESQPNG